MFVYPDILRYSLLERFSLFFEDFIFIKAMENSSKYILKYHPWLP